jgi:3-hydroxyisobutyrate dehydrogenase-like beta-hydroxyacid dehydrogenase
VLAELAELGGQISASPKDAAANSELVITMLPAAAHVRSVYLARTACWPASPGTDRGLQHHRPADRP